MSSDIDSWPPQDDKETYRDYQEDKGPIVGPAPPELLQFILYIEVSHDTSFGK